MESNIKRETLTVEEAGRILGIGRNKAYESVQRGDIPSLRFGKKIVVPREAIDRLLKSPNAEAKAWQERKIAEAVA